MIPTIRQRLSLSLEDRPYFQAHREDPSLGLHIGKPLQSRSVGVWFVSFSRRINNPDGSFGGIVVAALEPRYLKCFYKGLSLGERQSYRLAPQGRHASRAHARP